MLEHFCPACGRWEPCILRADAHGCERGTAAGYNWRTRKVREMD